MHGTCWLKDELSGDVEFISLGVVFKSYCTNVTEELTDICVAQS